MRAKTTRMIAAPTKSSVNAAFLALPRRGLIAKEAVTPTRMRNGAVRPSGTYLTRQTLAALKKVASKTASSNANR